LGNGETKMASGRPEVSLIYPWQINEDQEASWVVSYYEHAQELEGFVGPVGSCCRHPNGPNNLPESR